MILAKGGDDELQESVQSAAKSLDLDLKIKDTRTLDTFWSTSDESPEVIVEEVIDFAARGVYRAAKAGKTKAAVILMAAENTSTQVRGVESVRQSRFKEGARLALEVLSSR